MNLIFIIWIEIGGQNALTTLFQGPQPDDLEGGRGVTGPSSLPVLRLPMIERGQAPTPDDRSVPPGPPAELCMGYVALGKLPSLGLFSPYRKWR